MDIFEKCNQRYIQDEVRDLGIYPYFHALESRQDTEVIMEGKRRIMLGSNNYLGLTTNEAVVKAGMHAYETLGSGCSGSRFLNGTLKLHLELEDELSSFGGTAPSPKMPSIIADSRSIRSWMDCIHASSFVFNSLNII